MRGKYFFSDLKLLWAVCIIFALSIMGGSVYCGLENHIKCEEMQGYLTSFFSGIGDVNGYNAFIQGLKSLALAFAAITVAGFCKVGAVIVAAVLIKRGFVIGFTLSSFFRIFGAQGLWAVFAMLPELMIFCPALVFFSVSSTKMSVLRKKDKKNFLLTFIILSIFFGAIFCVTAFWNGYLTTTFMKLIANRVL